ncbi:rhodopsin, G0-coupled-like [Haliotis asinina]|uniref:rhodopsin, G0-coupled-like n=1 Tax=Haliotis asinina TaxID=109174 RepID=UPI00353252CF
MSLDIQALSNVPYFISGLLATIGNVCVLVVFCKHKKLRKNPHNQLLLNLVISDLGISLFGYPLTTSSNYAGRYLYGKVGCIIQGFMTFTLAQTDMNTLACLSVYRFISVCMPGDVHRLTRSVTIKVIIFLWLYSLLWTVPPLLGWSAYTYEPFGTSCSIDWDDKESGAVAYTWCLIIYCYIVHILIIAYCYYKIAMKAKEVHSRLKHFTIGGICNSDSMCLRRVQMERKSSLMSVLLTVTFIILWSPYAFVCVWSVYNPNLPNWITTWPTMFAKFTCTLNPFLYFMTHPTFKRHVMALFPRGKDPPPRSGQEMRPLG